MTEHSLWGMSIVGIDSEILCVAWRYPTSELYLSQLHFLKKARLHVVCMYTFYLFTESGLFTSRIRNYLVARSKIFSVSQPTNWGTRLLMDGKAWHWDSASWLWGSDPSSSVVFLGFVLCTLPPLSAILDLFLVSVLPPWSVFKYLNSL